MKMPETECVSVPKALLAEVLRVAMSDSITAENECAWADEHYAQHAAERGKIELLQKLANIATSP